MATIFAMAQRCSSRNPYDYGAPIEVTAETIRPHRELACVRGKLTAHSAPCPALERARHRYDELRDEGKADGPLVLFLVLDELAGSFEEQFLALDARLDEIQVELLTNSSRGSRTEVLAVRRRLTDAVQSLGWYIGDLDDLIAAGTAQLPGLGPGAQAHLDRHRQRVVRLTDAAREYREEAREALAQYSENVSGR